MNLITKSIKILLINVTLFLLLLYPNTVSATDNLMVAKDSMDSIMSNAENFINQGKSSKITFDENKLSENSKFTYNILLGIAIILLVIIGMILGIKYMMAGAEDKAEVKETLIPYCISAAIIFGAFTIWKIAAGLFS